MIRFLSFFLLFSLFISESFASVWLAENEWSSEWENKYSEWVKSAAVNPEIFHSKSSKYFGIKVDCADTTYALRIVFSFENKLPFQIINPLYAPGRPKYYSNETSHSSWDKLSTDIEKVVKFSNTLSEFLGTETLSLSDSYPVEFKALRSGDIFMYKISKAGAFIRHTYNIKGITDVGLFDLIYSTQERKKNNKPLAFDTNQKLSHLPTRINWGFKRFRLPESFSGDVKESENYSIEQYTLANKKGMTDALFFGTVQKIIKKSDETADVMTKRLLKDACDKVTERIGVVNGALTYQKATKNLCTNYTDFDSLSTPGRDQTLAESYLTLIEHAKNIEEEGVSNDIDGATLEILEALVTRKIDQSARELLLKFCPITYDSNETSLDLNTFFISLLDKKVSSHPNDDLKRRWGISSATPKTKCKAFY